LLALNSEGALYCGFGYGNYGPTHFLGTLVSSNFSFFSVLASNVAQVAAAGDHAYMIKTDGTLWAWGTNYKGECGQMTPTYGGPGIVSSPTQVGVATDWEKVSAGYECGYLKKTGSDQLYVIGHSSYDETNSMIAPSGFPIKADGTTPIFANETSVPTAVGVYTGSPGTVNYTSKKFRSCKSWTVVLEEA
jgi:hypothetical protein